MRKAFLLVLLLPMSAWLLQAQTIPGLGNATFPTSAKSAAAQRDFLRGLLLLHFFEYSDAAKLFVAAEAPTRICYGLLGRGDDLQPWGME